MSYSPTLGRWMEQDPAGYIDGVNSYQFVRSNPAQFTDSLGFSEDAERDAGIILFVVSWPHEKVQYVSGFGGSPLAVTELNITFPFDVHATFAPEKAFCLEYRQYVSGYQAIDGKKLKVLSGAPANEAWHEDGGMDQGEFIPWGHRHATAHDANWDVYDQPDRLRGTAYYAHDEPGLTGVKYWIRTTVDIHLNFRGVIINTLTGKTVAVRKWYIDDHEDIVAD